MKAIEVAPLRHHINVELATVPALRPFAWIARGASDVLYCWPANAAHGLLIVLLGWILLLTLGSHPYFFAAAVSGFLLVGPILVTGLCALSRAHEAGQPPSFDASLVPLAASGDALFKFGVVIALIAAGWFLISELILATAFQAATPDIVATFYRGFLEDATREQLLSYAFIGAILAVAVFAMSIVTVPLIIDRQARASQAMAESLRVVARNPMAMVLWGALIVVFVAIGLATWLFGLIICLPLLGHASWHAYRDLVRHL